MLFCRKLSQNHEAMEAFRIKSKNETWFNVAAVKGGEEGWDGEGRTPSMSKGKNGNEIVFFFYYFLRRRLF